MTDTRVTGGLGLPTKVIAIGIYSAGGKLLREVAVDADGRFEPFDVQDGEIVCPFVETPEGTTPGRAAYPMRATARGVPWALLGMVGAAVGVGIYLAATDPIIRRRAR